MKAVDDTHKVHRIGDFEFRVAVEENGTEAEDRWERRSEALAQWLIAEWQREQQRRVAERN